MARRRRRLSGFAALSGALDQSVKPTDVLVGAAAGVAGVALAKLALTKLQGMSFMQGKVIPDIVTDLVPAVGAAGVGAALYFAQKKSGRAAGHLAGAVATGLAISGAGLGAKYGIPGLSGVVSVNLGALVTRSFSPTSGPLNGIRQANLGRTHLGMVTADPRRQSMGLIASAPKPANARQLGLITPNARAKLSRVSGVRSVDF